MAIHCLLLAFRRPIRLDLIDLNRHSGHNLLFVHLYYQSPDPCEALCLKEEWEEERKFWLWRKSHGVTV